MLYEVITDRWMLQEQQGFRGLAAGYLDDKILLQGKCPAKSHPSAIDDPHLIRRAGDRIHRVRESTANAGSPA